jgi:hypothetical protein
VRVLGVALLAGTAALIVTAGAASQSLLPGQLDAAGREACAMTLGTPGADQRVEAVVLARRSDSRALRTEAGRAASAPTDSRFAAVELWCASND